MDGYGTPSFNDLVYSLYECPHNLVRRICAIVEVELHVIDASVKEDISVVQSGVEADHELYVALLEIIQAFDEGGGEFAL